MMSFRLIFKNVRKNLHDFLIYFITLMLSVSLFYAFNSIQSQAAFGELSMTKKLLADQMGNLISVLSVLIAIVLAFLIVYANQFLLKRRKKELGVYMLLGMNKGKISRIFAGETLLIGILALLSGLVFGLFISQGLSLISLKLFLVDLSQFQMVVSFPALQSTVLCFSIIFLIVMVCNVWTVSGVKLIDLFTAGRKNEVLTVKNTFVPVLCFFLSLGLMIGAWVLFDRHGILPDSNVFYYAIIILGIGTVLFFYSLATVLMVWVRKNKAIYLKGLNTFLIRQIGAKIRTNFLSMAIVCGLLTVVICVISTGISVAVTMNNNANSAAPYDITILATISRAGDNDIIKDLGRKGVDLDAYMERHVQISEYSSDYLYADLLRGQNANLWKHDEILPELPMPLISLSDYNQAMELQGKEPITLNENSFLLNCNYTGTIQYMERFLREHDSITLNGILLHSASSELSTETVKMTSVGNNDRGTFIVPDSITPFLQKEYNILNGIYDKSTNPDEVLTLLLPISVDFSSGYRYAERAMMFDMYFGSAAFLSFLCCYIGLVFLLICVALLALQQLTETADNVHRYGLIQKLGADSTQISGALFRQIGIYFFTPLAVAGLFSIFGIRKTMEIANQFLNINIATNMIFTTILLLVVYGGYFLATYFSCKNIVQERQPTGREM